MPRLWNIIVTIHSFVNDKDRKEEEGFSPSFLKCFADRKCH